MIGETCKPEIRPQKVPSFIHQRAMLGNEDTRWVKITVLSELRLVSCPRGYTLSIGACGQWQEWTRASPIGPHHSGLFLPTLLRKACSLWVHCAGCPQHQLDCKLSVLGCKGKTELFIINIGISKRSVLLVVLSFIEKSIVKMLFQRANFLNCDFKILSLEALRFQMWPLPG